MTEGPGSGAFGPTHPVTKLGRVVQQLRSFGELHAGELELLAVELDGAGASELAARLRAYRDVQRDEARMVVDELVDIQSDVSDLAVAPSPTVSGSDPAVNSPKRAKWLAEQAAEAERLRQPLSRRTLFTRAAPASEDATQ
ncbi:MAG: hypothetical protein JO057_04690 [Chloroflexi bacterium]|nr:hypothetical protein [Chloroflexota bacterium]